MSFACDRGDWIEVFGEHAIGDMSTLLGLYTLVAVLQELADWIATSHRDWIERIKSHHSFGCFVLLLKLS